MNVKDIREKHLHIRISEARLSEIKKKAREEKMTLADFVISKCLNLATEEAIITPERRKRIIK